MDYEQLKTIPVRDLRVAVCSEPLIMKVQRRPEGRAWSGLNLQQQDNKAIY